MTDSTPPPNTSARNRRLLIGGALALAVVCACCVIAAAVLILDPFGWNLLGMIFGRGDPLAASMPADTTYYMSVDLGKLTPEKVSRILKNFSDALELDETPDLDSVKEELDKSLLSNLGMTFKDDVEPWLGQFVAIGIWDLQLPYGSQSNSLENLDASASPGLVFAIESRNNGKADEFLQKWIEKSFPQGGEEIRQEQYGDATIYVSESQYGQGAAFARSGSVILISTTLENLKDAIDAQKGQSLADSADYREAVGGLPSGRLLTMYMDMGQMMDSYLSILDSMSTYSDQITPDQWETLKQTLEESRESMGGSAMSLSIVSAGLQLDSVNILDTSKMTEEQRLIAEKSGPAKDVIALLPEDTLFFLATKIPNESILALRDMLLNMGEVQRNEYDEAMQQFADEFGINPDTELIPYLGGELAVAVFPSSEGFLAQSSGVNLGGIVLLETSDGQAVLGVLDKLAEYAAQEGTPFDRKTSGELTYYVTTSTIGPPETTGEIALGVGRKYLSAATSGQSLEDVFSGKASLVQNDRYRKAVSALPGGGAPVLYLDLERLLEIVREGQSGYALTNFDESVKALKPITAIIADGGRKSGRTVRSTVVILIKPAE